MTVNSGAARQLTFPFRKRPPAPEPLQRKLGPIGVYRRLRSNSISAWADEVYTEPVVAAGSLLGDMVVLNAPEAIRRVFLDNAGNYPKDGLQIEKLGPALGRSLLTADGAEWKLQRRTVAPLFQPHAVETYVPDMAATVAAMLARWDPLGEIDMAREMTRLTYEVISKTVFSDEIETSPEVMGAAVTRYFEQLGRIDLWDVLPLPGWLPRPSLIRVRPAVRVFRTEVRRLLDRRRAVIAAGKPVPDDLVTLLTRARDPDTGSALSDDVIHDNLVTFIGAGHETTANALSWTLFLLAEFPAAFDRLAAEVDAVLAGRAPTADVLPRLVVTRMTIDESMRLYPPVPFLSRQAIAADHLAGADVAPGTRVIVAPWVLHRHRTLWQEPDLFEPERFAPGRRDAISRFAYLPFGAGPRICIGAGFAMQEMLIALAMIVRRFQPRPVPGARIEPVSRMTLRPKAGMPLRLERRS